MTQILRGLGSVVSNIGQGLNQAALGVASASDSWPGFAIAERQQTALDKHRAEQLELQKKEEERQKEAARLQGASSLITAANSAIKAAELFAETDDLEGVAQSLKTYLDYQEKFEQMYLSGEQPATSTSASATGTAPASPTVPGVAPSATVPGVQGTSDTAAQASSLASGMIGSNARSRHFKAINTLEEIAHKYGSTTALGQYKTIMGRHGTPELKAEAEATFQRMAAPTADERNEAREKLWNAAYDAVYKDGALSRDVWKDYSLQIEKYGGLSPEEVQAKQQLLLQGDLQIDIGVEAMRDLSRGSTVIKLAGEALRLMDETELVNRMGGLDGTKAALQDRIAGWDFLQEWNPPPAEAAKFRELINKLAGSTDLYGRLQSGATLTETEQIFYSRLIGSINQPAYMVRQNLRDLIQSITFLQDSFYEKAYASKKGNRRIAERILYGDAAPKDPSDEELEDPISDMVRGDR